MSLRRQRLLCPVGDTSWTTLLRAAIAPPYLDDCTKLGNRDAMLTFQEYLKYVTEQRLPRDYYGSRSLQLVAMDHLIRELSNYNNLDFLPIHLTKRLWETINKRCILNFHSWKLLIKALRKASHVTLGMLHYREAIKSPSSPLHVYTDPLTSHSFDFITALSITIPFRVPDLAKLSKISNLGILEIINRGVRDSLDNPGTLCSNVGDILIRAWSREATTSGAFAVLRILRLWNHPMVTARSLQYLQDFPVLGLFDIQNCGISDKVQAIIEAGQLGWVASCQASRDGKLGSDPASSSMNGAGLKSLECSCRATSSNSGLMWHGEKVSWVPRPTKPDFVIRSAKSVPNSRSSDGVDGHDFEEDADVDKEWRSIDYKLYCQSRGMEAWESMNTKWWTRLGEARHDLDLLGAGMKGVKKGALAGGYVVSPAPVAYIRLGEHPALSRPTGHSISCTFSKSIDGVVEGQKGIRWPPQSDLVFIRVKHLPLPAKTCPLEEIRERTAGGKQDGKGGKRNEEGFRRVRDRKRQKLGDVLEGFKLG